MEKDIRFLWPGAFIIKHGITELCSKSQPKSSDPGCVPTHIKKDDVGISQPVTIMDPEPHIWSNFNSKLT